MVISNTSKERADRNRTLVLDDSEVQKYASRCITLASCAVAQEVENTTINQDLFDCVDFLPSKFADLIVIDPPYNIDKDFHGTVKFKRMNDSDYISYLETWFPKIMRLLKDNGSLYVCCDWKTSPLVYSVIVRYCSVLNRITWQREKGRGAKHNWKNGMEDIWFCVKDERDYYFDVDSVKQKRKVIAPYKEAGKPKDWQETEDGNFRITYPSNFWDDISIPYWSMPENTDHPTQKPEKLVAKLILASCPEGGIVFDPFLGSGTTSVVAKKLGRRYCGVEINPLYAAWAEKRLELAESNTEIQGYNGGVFWERNSLPSQKKIKKEKNKEAQGELFL